MSSDTNPNTKQSVYENYGFVVGNNYGEQIVNNFGKLDNYWTEKKDFEEYKSPKFPQILEKRQLIKIIRNERLLMIGGSHEDKLYIVKYVAALLVESLKQTSKSQNTNPCVLELTCDEKTRISDAEISNEDHKKGNKNNNIFVLYDFKPNHVNKNLQKIQDAAKTSNNYIIACTDVPCNQWLLERKGEELFWWEPSHEKLYEPEDLAEALIQRIDKDKLPDKDIAYIREHVGEQLKTFTSIGRCVRALNLEKTPLNKETIDEAIQNAKDSKISLEKWYRNDLNSREQLLAIGLSFFDGLFEDQLFAALEQVVDNVWQRRDPSLQALDYCDFANLGNHHNRFKDKEEYKLKLNSFIFVKLETYATDIEIYRSRILRSDERLMLFSVAWESHRRQIITALPIIVKLVKDSVLKVPSNWELYGDPIRCKRLRETIIETLSDLGLVSTSSTSAVQDALMQLSADENFDVQDVAAKAMTRWYCYDGDKLLGKKKLLGTLQRFYSFAIQEYQTEEDKKAKDCIGATVALAVSYAAEIDYNYNQHAHTQLSKELCDWLKELAENQEPIVRYNFRNHTLPNVVLLHLRQLHNNGILKGITQKHADLNNPIAVSLAIAALVDSRLVRETLDSWYQECMQEWSVNPRKTTQQLNLNQRKITKYHTLLRTVALTYGLIQYDTKPRELTVNQSFRRLHRILVEEENKFICDGVVFAICLLAKNNLLQIEIQLQTLVSEFSKDKRNEIMKILTDIYRDAAKIYRDEAKIYRDEAKIYRDAARIYRDAAKIPTSTDKLPPKLETLLRIVALTYEAVHKNQEKGTLTIQNAFLHLFNLLLDEENKSISKIVTIAIRILASKHFDKIELETLPSKLTSNQSTEIVNNMLTEIYLDQRANLKGGNKVIKVKGCDYPVWIRSQRELTAIEKVVYRWIKSDNTMSHKIAIQASVSFARELEQTEQQEIK